MEATRLSALISSFVLHDLASPLQSVMMSMDMLHDADMGQASEDNLRKGAASMEAKLKYLRYAVGSVGIQSGHADMFEVRAFSEAYLASHKMTSDWRLTTALSFQHARILMNLLIIMKTGMPRGGDVTVDGQESNGELTLTVQGKGKRASLKEEHTSSLKGDQPESGWDARNIQPYFTRQIIMENDGSLSFDVAEDCIELNCKLKI